MTDPTRRNLSQPAAPGRLTLADECAAFLSGDYLDYVRDTGALGQLPWTAWMVLNPVAHGSAERVQKIASFALPLRHHKMSWHQCRARIAAALVAECAGEEETLARLQRDALVPLELALIDELEVTPQLLLQLSVLALEVQTFGDSG